MCDLFNDDLDLVVLAFKELGQAQERPSLLMQHVESLKMAKISIYVDKIMQMKRSTIIKWKVSKLKRQTNMFDYL